MLAQNLSGRGIHIEVVQGLRTFAEQDKLYRQGRTEPGQRVTNAKGGLSKHNYGVAVDVAPMVNGKIDWDDLSKFAAIGAASKKLGLMWGGDWKKFVDKPHVELPSPDIKTMRKLFDKGGLQEVWKEVNATKLKPVADFVFSNALMGTLESESEPIETISADGDTSTPAPAKPENPAPQDIKMQPTTAEDKTSKKSLWATVLAIPGLLLTWLAANVGEAVGFLKDKEVVKWVVIAAGVIAAIYLIRQMVKMALTLVANIIYNVVSMWSQASPATNNVKIISPAPREEVKE